MGLSDRLHPRMGLIDLPLGPFAGSIAHGRALGMELRCTGLRTVVPLVDRTIERAP